MRRKVSAASSCTAAVAGCSLLNLIFNPNSTTANHSSAINPRGHFQALCKSWRGAEIWVQHHIYLSMYISKALISKSS